MCPVALLLTVVALAFAAFSVVAISFGDSKGLIILALSLTLGGLILRCVVGLCMVGLLRNHVDQL